ncbi:MAG: phosphoglycerol transferase [Bacteroidetes bacterium]|nr:MAG: phosphoglycerol transferase [Bacteroidota bacterium]
MKRFRLTLEYLLGVQLLGLIALSLFRTVEYIHLHHMVQEQEASVARAFLHGLWFDNVIACYLMLLPLAVLGLTGALGSYSRTLRRGASLWFCILYPIAFVFSAANIPYFEHFVKNINSGVLEWAGYLGTTAGMLLQETSFLVWIALYLLVTLAFIWLMRRLRRRYDQRMASARKNRHPRTTWLQRGARASMALLLIGICVLGIRGRIGTTPIRASTVYYCNDTFLNQLGINPAFNFLYSLKEDHKSQNARIALMDDAKALRLAQQEYRVPNSTDSIHPLRRHISNPGEVQRTNVVLILMESMSANYLKRFGQQKNLTPNIDSLYNASLAFTNFYSTGIHTNQGLTGLLYSFPALLKRNMMKGIVPRKVSGLPTVLAENGWQTLIFIPHEAQYDNMNAFLRNNGMEQVYEQADYPSEEIVSNFGVPDHYLFQYSIETLRQKAKADKPFFATILTVSNHEPFVIPDWFKSQYTDPKDQIVAYADWCIGDFLRKAQKEAWYDNTIFVICADHGILVDGNIDAEMPQSYNHIAMLMLGKGIQPRLYAGLGMQEDVMPTLLGMLNISYTYDGFGVDLLRTKRKRVFYVADEQVAARDSTHVNVYSSTLDRSFRYHTTPNGGLTLADSCRPAFDSLEQYSRAMTQAAQWVFLHD